MLTVTVNDRPLNVAAIVEHGRVLLPMRATLTALGARVSYDPHGHVVVARSAGHALRLRIGSHTALVDGRRVGLRVAARIVAARTYVPLRIVAQALGAVVGYDARAQLVSVVTSAPHAVSALNDARVSALTPADGGNVGTAYPTISASLVSATASRSQITLTVDGQDVTALSSFDGSTITYMPRIGLAVGRHSVRFAGRTRAHAPFSVSWDFETSRAVPPDAPSFEDYDYRFYVSGPTYYYPGDWMHFILIAPPGGSAELQLCGLGYDYALWNTGNGSVYEANFPAPGGYWLPSCTVTATYTAWNGRDYYVPIPVIIGLYTSPRVQPTPKPSAQPKPVPTGPRRSEPTPAPVVTLHPVPLPTRHPLPLPTLRPRPPVPTPHAVPPAAATPVPSPPKPRPRPHPVQHPLPRRTP